VRTVLLVSLATLLLASCTATSPGSCSPVGFVACSGNTLVSCVASSSADAGTSGITVNEDCTAAHQFCLGSGFTGASCGAPVTGERCFGRDTTGCAASDQLLRCVWVSEQPEPGLIGDVGVWRIQTDCAAMSQVCPLATAACAAP